MNNMIVKRRMASLYSSENKNKIHLAQRAHCKEIVLVKLLKRNTLPIATSRCSLTEAVEEVALEQLRKVAFPWISQREAKSVICDGAGIS